jgi:hypothetical protein
MSPALDLRPLEASVQDALAVADPAGLEILGYGEISIVVRWGDNACKRLPIFASAAAFDAYRRCLEDYVAALGVAGVGPLVTHVETVPLTDGALAAYCVQPALRPEELLPCRFAADPPDEVDRLFDLVLDRVRAAVSPRLGLDGQLSNWALHEGELTYLDVSTPLMRDAAGRELLDVELFLASLPWAVRGLVRRTMLRSILDKYYEPRGVVLDLLGNLHKERLGRLVPRLVERANARVRPAITEEEVRRYYASDARTWALMQGLRRADRAWQRWVRGRVYPFLLPGRIER